MKRFFKNFFFVVMLLFSFSKAFAQERKVTGQVVSAEDGFSLPGATIVIKGTQLGTSTDLEGKFELNAETNQELEISYVGFDTQLVKISSANSYSIKLLSSTNVMDELIVVGYGVQKKSDVTGAIGQVKGEDIATLVTPSFETQLAGRTAGVQITTSGGVIGEAPKINIRGIGSISSGTNPLIVLDGVPLLNNDININVDNNSLADINPQDIESFEVLKDGAATAIYGSRATNGVILITTKRGKKNSFKLNFSTLTGLATPTKKYKLLGASDFVMISNEKRTNNDKEIWAKGTEFNTDWQDLIFRKTALQTDHNLNVSGGTDKGRYFLSLGYGQQEGISVANDMTRYTLRTSVDQDINTWLTIGASVGLTRNDVDAMNKNNNGLSGHIFNAVKQLPNVPVYDSENASGYNILDTGTIGNWENIGKVGGQLPNIMYTLKYNFYNSKTERNIINVYADAKIAEGLTYRLQMGYDKNHKKEATYWNPIHGDGVGYKGLFQQYALEDQMWNVQNILSYQKSFADKHNLNVTAVAEFQKNEFNYFYATGREMTNEFFNQHIITNAFATQQIGGNAYENGMKSFIARAAYNFDGRYYFQVSARRDGLSSLHKDNRWQNFFGYSLAWNIANETFWETSREIMNDFKLRASYAEVGNTTIGNYPYKGLYGLSNYGDLNGISYDQFGNNDLLWEASKKLNFGVDLGFLNNRFRFTADYFVNDIENMIFDKLVSPSLGVPDNKIKINAGKMRNKGLELSFDATLVNTDNFNWNVGINSTFMKNEVQELPDGNDIFFSYSTNPNINGNIIIREGESVHSLYGYDYWGVNTTNGNPVYYKADGSLVQGDIASKSYYVFDPNNPSEMTTKSTLSATEDRKILGNTLPKYYGGFHSTMKYKNFDMSFLVRFSGGNKIFNHTRRELLTQNFNNNSTEILGRWQSPQNPGDGRTPRLSDGDDAFVNMGGILTSRFVEKGDFISLDNIQVGYNFNSDILKRLRLDSFRVYVVAQNVAIFTDYKGIDPEMITYYGVDAFGTPKSRIVSLGINLSL